MPGVSNNAQCLSIAASRYINPTAVSSPAGIASAISIPIRSASLDNEGHNYFLSQNPYVLNSYAVFGEAYYNITKDLKLTARPALDRRPEAFHRNSQRSVDARLWLSFTGVIDQEWKELTGRAS